MTGQARQSENIPARIADAARALLAAAPSLPSQADMEAELADGIAAQSRGYYAPDEDERLRVSYHQYLAIRVSLWQTLQTLLPIVDGKHAVSDTDFERSYGIALCAASMLMRTGCFLLDIAKDRPVVWKKLDEAEPRFGIQRKSFTAIYKGLTAPKIIAKYHKSWRYYHRNSDDIHAALTQAGQDSAVFARVSECLLGEVPIAQTGLWRWIPRRLSFRKFSYKRRHISAARKVLFTVFELSGSHIAELKQPFVKAAGAPKRVTDEVRARVLEIARPGDVFVTRHDDALSNVFLPGFWPHAALYVGSEAERAQINGPKIDPARHVNARACVFLESKKDGVLFRPIEDTLELDAFVILRPKLKDADIAQALNAAASHAGKLYDFSFDFSSADRLACTELIYRSYHKVGNIRFALDNMAGRQCLSAESLMIQMLGQDAFDVVAIYGLDYGSSPNLGPDLGKDLGQDEWLMGGSARKALLGSFEHNLTA